MQFSTVATVAAVAAVANAQYNTTVTATTVENQTTLVTITDCEEHICKETVSPALVSTATVTENNTVTKYTTWCPLSGAEVSTKTVEATTSTSTKAAETTTSTKAEEKTTSTKAAETTATAETTTVTKAVTSTTSTEAAETTTTTKAQTTKAETTTAATTTKAQTTVEISSYTGAAAQVLPAAGALIAGAAALLL